MSAFDERETGCIAPASLDGQACPTASVEHERQSHSPAPLRLPPPVKSDTFASPSHFSKPRPASFQSFGMSSYGPYRGFASPYASQPGARHRQDSEVHSAKYDSAAESSVYESPWFSSSSQSLVSPGSPQSGYNSAGSMRDLPPGQLVRHDGRPRHRATHSYTFGGSHLPLPGSSSAASGLASKAASLGLRASSEEAPGLSAGQELTEEEDEKADAFGVDMDVTGSGDDSEYLEGLRSLAGAVRKRPRKLKAAGQVDDGEESVGP